MSPLPPGSTIGILGGGQLGRMLAVAAASNQFTVGSLTGNASTATSFGRTAADTGPVKTPNARTVDNSKGRYFINLDLPQNSTLSNTTLLPPKNLHATVSLSRRLVHVRL